MNATLLRAIRPPSWRMDYFAKPSRMNWIRQVVRLAEDPMCILLQVSPRSFQPHPARTLEMRFEAAPGGAPASDDKIRAREPPRIGSSSSARKAAGFLRDHRLHRR